MEYVHQRGSFDDLPLAQIVEDFRRLYGESMLDANAQKTADFQKDVERETR
jgi:hypothetical protein